MLALGYLLLHYKIYIDFITTLIIGVLHFTTFSRASVSKI